MRTLKRLLSCLRSLFRRSTVEREMAEEMRAHLQLQEEANRARGMDAEEARYAARRQFGGVAQVQERCREQRSFRWAVDLWRDLRFAGRGLRRSPGFATAVVLSLALCLGANTAVFSMLYALVLRPLPFSGATQLVEIYNTFPKVGMAKLASNVGQYQACGEHIPELELVALWRLDECTLDDGRGPVRLSGAVATAEIFDLLHVRPLLGRFFTAEEQVPKADNVVVLTESLWKAQFRRDPAVVGRKLRLDGKLCEIIGVAPKIMESFDARVRLVRPLSWDHSLPPGETGYSPRLFGLVRPGLPQAQIAAQVMALERKIHDTASPKAKDFYERTGHGMRVEPLAVQRAEPVVVALSLLQGGVLFVLLIGTVNVALLLLARANARRRELAVRMALGAGLGTIARQLLTESLLLAALGGTGGVALAWAWAALTAVTRFAAQLLPEAPAFGLDWPVLGGATLLTGVVAVLVGLFPVLFLWRGWLVGSSAASMRGSTAGRGVRAASGTLLVAQVAFASLLLIGAGLLGRSFLNVLAVPPGFEVQTVLGARIAVPEEEARTFPPRLAAALAQLPGVKTSLASATPFVLVPPYGVSMPLGAVLLRDHPLPADEALPSVFYCGADTHYQAVLQIPLRAGRWFDEADMARGRVTVVDEGFARRYFPAGDAVGRRLALNVAPPVRDEDWLEIVGVVGDVRHNGAEDRSGQPFLYLPLGQTPLYGTLSVLFRTGRPTGEMAAQLRCAVTSVDPELAVYGLQPMTETIGDSFGSRRGVMALLALFAGTALLLTAVGLYGVLAYDVSRRSREIGIRSALGATRTQIALLVLRHGLMRTGLGVVIGLACALAVSRFLDSQLYAVESTDPAVYWLAVAVVGCVALMASWLPARRAARIDPAVTLRAE